jgi:hypothetical protein
MGKLKPYSTAAVRSFKDSGGHSIHEAVGDTPTPPLEQQWFITTENYSGQ